MAIIDVNFYSNKLCRQVTYRAIIPIDGPYWEKKNQEFKPLKPYIYYMESWEIILTGLVIQISRCMLINIT